MRSGGRRTRSRWPGSKAFRAPVTSYGDVRREEIERLQRQALDAPRPQLVVRADRFGLNEHHPLAQRLHAALERVLRPIVEAEERRAGAHVVHTGRALRARDEVGLHELNEALRTAFDAPGSAGFSRGGVSVPNAPRVADASQPAGSRDEQEPDRSPRDDVELAAMRFKQTLLRMHPGEQRGVSLLFDPERIAPGTLVEIAADHGVSFKLWSDTAPTPNRRGWSRLTATIRTRATVEPGSRLAVIAEAGAFSADVEIVVVRHRGSGWVREIARKDEDSAVEAHFDVESGVVTVFEGRPEFRALEHAPLSRSRTHEHLPYRILEVEAPPTRRISGPPSAPSSGGPRGTPRPTPSSTRAQSGSRPSCSATRPTNV